MRSPLNPLKGWLDKKTILIVINHIRTSRKIGMFFIYQFISFICNETVRNITGHSPTLSRVPSEFSDIKKLPHTACRSLPYRGRKTFYAVFLCEQ